MWGNTKGWLISALIAALFGGWIYFIAAGSAQTPPTAFSAEEKNFAAIALPTPPAELLPKATDIADPASFYREAIARFFSNRIAYETFAQRGTLDSPEIGQLNAIGPLLQAASAREVRLFAPRPQELINYDHTKPPLEALRVLGQVCIDRLGLLNHRAAKYAEAMKHYQAGFALGRNLAAERLTYEEFQLGQELMSKSAAAMASLLDETLQSDRAAAIRDYNTARADYIRDRVTPTLRIVKSIDPKIVGQHTGDVFELATRSAEPMWRVEAILQLGRVRHFAGAGGTAGNQRNAMKLLRQLAEEDPDPIIRAAATAARDLTIEQHRMQ